MMNDDPLPVCIDLQAFAEKMEARDKEIPRKVRAVKIVQACFTDIKGALVALETLQIWRSRTTELSPEQFVTIENSLLSKAVILYGRATHGSSEKGGRGSIQIRSSLPPELQRDHDFIIDLRNKAIAHSHPGKAIGGSVWEEQVLLLVDTGSGYKPMHTMRTTQTSPQAIAALERLLAFARSFYFSRFQRVSGALVDLLHNAGFSENELLACATDPTQFFLDKETAREAISRMPK